MKTRPRPGQNSKTETSSKIRDSALEFRGQYETWKFVHYANIFLKIFQNICHHFEVERFFEFLAFFLRALVVTHLQIHQKRARWITEIFLSHIVAVAKVWNNRLVSEICSLPDRDETWNFRDRDSQKWSRDESRDQGQVSRPILETPSFTGSNFAVRHRLPRYAFYKTCAHIGRRFCCPPVIQRLNVMCRHAARGVAIGAIAPPIPGGKFL